ESGRWYLYLVTPLVAAGGPKRSAYRRVNEVYRQMPQPFAVEPLEFKVVGPHSPLGEALANLQRRYPGSSSPVWYRGARLGGLAVEGAYVYPPTPAPVG